MKYILVCLLVLFSILSIASDETKIMDQIKKECSFFNKKIPLDIRIDCMTDYINCSIVGSGEIDLNKVDNVCLKRAAKRRKDDV